MLIYLSGHKNNVLGILSETSTFPLTNPDTIIAPLDIDEWRKENESNVLLSSNPFGFQLDKIPNSMPNNFVSNQTNSKQLLLLPLVFLMKIHVNLRYEIYHIAGMLTHEPEKRYSLYILFTVAYN